MILCGIYKLLPIDKEKENFKLFKKKKKKKKKKCTKRNGFILSVSDLNGSQILRDIRTN